jgi:hypothetical protein
MSKPYGVRAHIRSIAAELKKRRDELVLAFGAANDNVESLHHNLIRANESKPRSVNAHSATSLP